VEGKEKNSESLNAFLGGSPFKMIKVQTDKKYD
jgi:hypothetical protein